MIGTLQLGTVSPGQLTSVQPSQLTTAPGVTTLQISDLLNSLMPLIMLMMVMMMLVPMMKGMGEAFKAK
jgi:hypothetical protein